MSKLLDGGLVHGGAEYEFVEKLGAGRFASVYSLRCTSNVPPQAGSQAAAAPMVAKVTQLQGISTWARAQLSEEIAIWETLEHPHIVRMYGHLADASRHVLLLEHALGGELFERIVTMTSFCEAHAARQVGQVLSAVEYLHSIGVLHRDLKPENLLLESDADDASVKVADFGGSKLVKASAGQAQTPCGSLGYAAPEQLKGLKFAQAASDVPMYDMEVDIWSVGVITYILLSGTMPFDPGSYTPAMLERNNALQFPEETFGAISAEAKAFIRALLHIDPTQRLTASAALRHSWLEANGAVPVAAVAAAATAGRASGSMGPPPATPGSRLTPLGTPSRLRQLKDSGQLRKAWDTANEASVLAPLSARAKPASAAGSELEAARQAAHKRAVAEIEENADEIPLLAMPAEVTKRLRSESNESRASSSGGAGSGAGPPEASKGGASASSSLEM